MQADGLDPFAFGDAEGWPAMGIFDILDMRMNGYRFHQDLLAGRERWTDPRVEAVFVRWVTLLPYFQDGSLERRHPGCRPGDARRPGRDGLLRDVPRRGGDRPCGMTTSTCSHSRCSGTSATTSTRSMHRSTATCSAGRPGTSQPRSGSCTASRAAMPKPVSRVQRELRRGGRRCDGRRLHALSAHPADHSQVRGGSPVPRPRHAAGLRRAGRMQRFLREFLRDPGQDLPVFLARIQSFYEGLPPRGGA